MDPLTHVALGIAVAVAVGPTSLRLRDRAFVGAAAGLLPDADLLLSSKGDPLFTLEYHRHFTHSLVFSPVVAAVASALAWSAARIGSSAPNFRDLLLPAWAATLSHLACDAWTSYGTRLGWPFDDRRVAMDLISVVDPLLTLPLLASLIWAWRRQTRRPVLVGLAWVGVYLSACAVQQQRARGALDEWIVSQNMPAAARVTVKPSFANILVWRAVHLHDTTLHATAIRCGLGPPQVLPGASHHVFPSPDHAVAHFRLPAGSIQARDIARFYRLSEGWIGLHPEKSDLIGDLRYATLPHTIAPLWNIRIASDQPDRPVEWAPQRSVQNAPWSTLWQMISGRAGSGGLGPP